MKRSFLFIAFGLMIVKTNLIVDREIDSSSFAEGMPSTIKYTFYNTFGQ